MTAFRRKDYYGFRLRLGFVWVLLHAICCIITLIVGVRSSRVVLFLVFSANQYPAETEAIRNPIPIPLPLAVPEVAVKPHCGSDPPPTDPRGFEIGTNRSRVGVGRHRVVVRPWPHPDPLLVFKSYQIMERVQEEQRRVNRGLLRDWRTVIVVTPTYRRTFQAYHLNGLVHTLMLLPQGKVTWIVVEAGGVSNATSSLLARWRHRVRVYHIPFLRGMPACTPACEERRRVEIQMQVEGLRFVREQRLDGIVVFGDDSNSHRTELFDEIQGVKWMGAFSVGILRGSLDMKPYPKGMPIQGPACNSSAHLVGWHTFAYHSNATVVHDDLPRRIEWAGFALNARLVWEDGDAPGWVRHWDDWTADMESIDSPLSMLKEESHVEPLGRCGREVLVWWLRAEARVDGKFPSRWIIEPPLEVVVPAKSMLLIDPLPEPCLPQSIYLGSATFAYMNRYTGKSGKASKPKQSFHQINRRKNNMRM